VIQRSAIGSGGQQRHVKDARLLVKRHQLPDLVGAFDIALECVQTGGGTVIPVRNDRSALQPLFGHAYPSGGGRPQRLHECTVHARQQVDGIVKFLQGLQVMRVVDPPAGIDDRDAHGITQTRQLLTVLQIVGDEGVIGRDHLFKAGVELKPCRLPAQQRRDQQAQHKDDTTVVKQRSLKQRARALIEIGKVAIQGHRAWWVRGMHGLTPQRSRAWPGAQVRQNRRPPGCRRPPGRWPSGV
nr:hypothetical protein [Tanacetum cinerariifolium]